jgi:hypothetical protein
MSAPNPSRRAFVKRLSYVAPAVLTLTAAPEYAKAGSVKLGDHGGGWERDRGGGAWDWDLGLGRGKGKGHKDKDEKGGKGKGKRE